MKIKFLFILLICFSISHAQETDLKDFLDYSFPSELSASPTLAAICWAESDEGIRNLYYAKGPDYTPVQLTQYSKDDGQAILQPVFTADHKAIIYVRGSAANRQGEIPNPYFKPRMARPGHLYRRS